MPRTYSAHDTQAIVDMIGRLVEGIARVRNGDVQAGPQGPHYQRWEDADHVYVEADLPRLADIDADVCIHDGRVFISVCRPDA